MIDLNVVEFFKIKSTFFEIGNPKKINNITECIYKYPNMNINELSDDFLNKPLDKFFKENKIIFSLVNYDIHPATSELLESLSSHYLLPIGGSLKG